MIYYLYNSSSNNCLHIYDVSGMRQDLREGMTTLSASISAVHASQVEGTETVLVSFDSEQCRNTLHIQTQHQQSL